MERKTESGLGTAQGRSSIPCSRPLPDSPTPQISATRVPGPDLTGFGSKGVGRSCLQHAGPKRGQTVTQEYKSAFRQQKVRGGKSRFSCQRSSVLTVPPIGWIVFFLCVPKALGHPSDSCLGWQWTPPGSTPWKVPRPTLPTRWPAPCPPRKHIPDIPRAARTSLAQGPGLTMPSEQLERGLEASSRRCSVRRCGRGQRARRVKAAAAPGGAASWSRSSAHRPSI